LRIGVVVFGMFYTPFLSANCNAKVSFEKKHWNALPTKASSNFNIRAGESQHVRVSTVTKVKNTGQESFVVNYGGVFGAFSKNRRLNSGHTLNFSGYGTVNHIKCPLFELRVP